MDYDSIIKSMLSEGATPGAGSLANSMASFERKKQVQQLLEEARRQQMFENEKARSTMDYNASLAERQRAEIPFIGMQKEALAESTKAQGEERKAKAMQMLQQAQQQSDYSRLAPINSALKGGAEGQAMHTFDNIYPSLSKDVQEMFRNKEGGWNVTPEMLRGVVDNLSRDKTVGRLQEVDKKEEGANLRKEIDAEQKEKDRQLKERLKNIDKEIAVDKQKLGSNKSILSNLPAYYQQMAEQMLQQGSKEEALIFFKKAQHAAALKATENAATQKEGLDLSGQGVPLARPATKVPTYPQELDIPEFVRDPTTGKIIRKSK